MSQGEGGAAGARGFYDGGEEGAEGSISVACKGLLRVTLLSYLELIKRRVAQRRAQDGGA